ncbi:hypothetical protein KKF82_06705 [Patescibacteria group bacterium]|nr:hypothetical protein [Patescibacteria group bacterium]
MPWGDYSLEFAWFEDPPDPTSWVEAGERCFTASFARGRDSQLDQINPLSGSCLMNNSARHFSFDYALGPYYGYLLPKRVGRMRCTYREVQYDLARFMVSEITPDDRYDVQQATIKIFDAQTWLEQIAATHTYTDLTTGELIAEALDEAGWPADLRQLDAGQLAGINVTYTDVPIWSGHILKGLESERGIAFIGRDGAVVYQDRHHRYKGAHLTPQAVFVDGMRDFRPSLSYREIANDVVVTYAGGGTVQRIDASSQDAYGPMRLPVTAELLGLGDATSLAEWLLDRRKDPHSKPPRLLITNGTEAKYQALLDLEISDRVRVTDSRSGIATVDFYIEGIQHDIDFRQHTHQAEYTLTLCDVDRYLLIGVPGYAEFGSGKFGY